MKNCNEYLIKRNTMKKNEILQYSFYSVTLFTDFRLNDLLTFTQ